MSPPYLRENPGKQSCAFLWSQATKKSYDWSGCAEPHTPSYGITSFRLQHAKEFEKDLNIQRIGGNKKAVGWHVGPQQFSYSF